MLPNTVLRTFTFLKQKKRWKIIFKFLKNVTAVAAPSEASVLYYLLGKNDSLVVTVGGSIPNERVVELVACWIDLW